MAKTERVTFVVKSGGTAQREFSSQRGGQGREDLLRAPFDLAILRMAAVLCE